MATTPYAEVGHKERSALWLYDAAVLAGVAAATVGMAALFLYQEWRLVGQLGMPLDDAWIHFRMAENIAHGLGFSFNPGEPTSASTSPAWTALLALAYMLSGQFIVPAIVIGTSFAAITAFGVYFSALAIKPDRRVAVAAALICTVTGRWVWSSLSGMETTLFTALTVWGLLAHCRNSRRSDMSRMQAPLLLAASALVRPEGFLLFGLTIVDTLYTSSYPFKVGVIPSLRRALRGPAAPYIGAIGAAVLLRVAYTWSTGGGLTGNTFSAQSLPQGDSGYTGPRLLPDFWYLRAAIRSLAADNFILGMFVPVGIIYLLRLAFFNREARRPAGLSMLWLLGLPLFASVLVPNLRHHERYLMPLIPFTVLAGTFGVDFLVRYVAGHRSSIRVPFSRASVSVANLFLIAALLCLGDAAIDGKRWATQYAGDSLSIQKVNVQLGQWLRDNTPPNAYVAMNDIGAIAFVSKRRVLDTVGIAEPGILPYLKSSGRDGVFQYLQQKRPDYLVIWPEWYPEMAAMTDIFQPVYSVRMDQPVTSTRESMLGGEEMVVYKIRWP